ncbi:hypothetical protein D3C71_2250860 [compost metagenome]
MDDEFTGLGGHRQLGTLADDIGRLDLVIGAERHPAGIGLGDRFAARHPLDVDSVLDAAAG